MPFPFLRLRAARLLTAAALAVWLGHVALRERPSIPVLQPGAAYALGVESDQTAIDLAFDGDTRYVLIVSSLAPGDSECTVTFSSTPAAAIASVPARALPPLSESRTMSSSSTVDPVRRVARASLAGRGRTSDGALPPSHAKPREFHLHVAGGNLDDPRQYARVRARVVGEGAHIRVYLDDRIQPHALAPGLVEEIVERFDEEIVPLTARWLGTYRDVDGDGTFAVLLTSWLGRLEGGRTSLGGFVRGSDFRRDLPPPFSNRCDMLYLNAELRPGPHLRALLAHEFAHAVCFSERLAPSPLGAAFPDEEDWLNEAIAHLAENLYGASWTNLDYRISRYLADTARYPLVVPDYYQAGLWRNHGCRGATFLLLRWCVDQFGEDLLRRLVRGPLPGIRNLESATGLRFDELFRRWTVALACADPDAPGAYRSIDPYGMLPGWGLGGPRMEPWEVDGNARLLVVRGTATAFVELKAREPGIHTVRVRGTPGAALQVTLIPLPADAPRLELEAEWDIAGASAAGGASGGPPSSVRVRAQARGDDVRIEWLACEQHNGESRVSACFPAEKLAPETESVVTGQRGMPGDAADLGTYVLPVPRNASRDAELIVKAAARDAHGRRTVAWARVSPPAARGDDAPALAARTARRTASSASPEDREAARR